MAFNINARSPFIVQVNELNQLGSKLHIWIWTGTGFAPTQPTHIVSKLAPSTSNTSNEYNVSPYIREYLTHNTLQSITTSITATPTDQWVNVKIQRYKKTGSGYVSLSTTTYKAYDGYGLYEEGYNPDHGDFFLNQGTHYYWVDANLFGHVTIEKVVGYYVKWTNLNTGVYATSPLSSGNVVDIPRVFPTYYQDGNILEIYNASNVAMWQAIFKPISECKYTPVTLDFVNKYGAWQREFMFKASFEEFEIQSTQYNLMQSNAVYYSTTEGQFSDFNVNGKQTIKVNTGFERENWNDVLKQIYLSERIMLDGRPVTLKKKSEALIKDINAKIRNYTLEFQYANEMINSVI